MRRPEGLRDAASRYPGPPELGELEISVTPTRTPDDETAARFFELGVHRLVLMPRRPRDEARHVGLSEDAVADFVQQVGERARPRGGCWRPAVIPRLSHVDGGL